MACHDGPGSHGTTTDIAAAWGRYYHREAFRVPNNPNAAARSWLMAAIAEVLK